MAEHTISLPRSHPKPAVLQALALYHATRAPLKGKTEVLSEFFGRMSNYQASENRLNASSGKSGSVSHSGAASPVPVSSSNDILLLHDAQAIYEQYKDSDTLQLARLSTNPISKKIVNKTYGTFYGTMLAAFAVAAVAVILGSPSLLLLTPVMVILGAAGSLILAGALDEHNQSAAKNSELLQVWNSIVSKVQGAKAEQENR